MEPEDGVFREQAAIHSQNVDTRDRLDGDRERQERGRTRSDECLGGYPAADICNSRVARAVVDEEGQVEDEDEDEEAPRAVCWNSSIGRSFILQTASLPYGQLSLGTFGALSHDFPAAAVR